MKKFLIATSLFITSLCSFAQEHLIVDSLPADQAIVELFAKFQQDPDAFQASGQESKEVKLLMQWLKALKICDKDLVEKTEEPCIELVTLIKNLVKNNQELHEDLEEFEHKLSRNSTIEQENQ